MRRHRGNDSLLEALLRRFRQAGWARHLRRHERRQRAITRRRGQPVPPALPLPLKSAWLAWVEIEHPGWKPGERGWRLAAHALVQFFDASAAAAPLGCALPSRAADLVWHLWIEHDPDGLAAWQQQRYGRTVAHREHEAGDDTGEALARCLVRAARAERISPVKGPLPLVFRVDGILGTPWGWAYERIAGTVRHKDLLADGRAGGSAHPHDALMPAALLTFGLVSWREAGPLARERAKTGDKTGDKGDGSSCGSACGGSLGGGDHGCGGGAGDGCSDGGSSGSSCGSSCGSGCGS